MTLPEENRQKKFTFLALSQEDRSTAFAEAATKLSSSAVMLEKDFWVSWLLGLLFKLPALKDQLVFKGGTSLSKVFGIINRFSEDIDLSINPSLLGIDESVFDALTSRTKRDTALVNIQNLCADFTKNQMLPLLEKAITEELDSPHSNKTWLEYENDIASHSPVIYFLYPTTQPEGFKYLRRAVKLELGSLTDQQPVDIYSVRPYVADEFPKLFVDWHCEVKVLDLSRSFWEKATILHAEYHRPEELMLPDRYARHYADMACLLESPRCSNFLQDEILCDRVAEWKSRIFGRQWARYDLARKGSFRFVPPPNRMAALARDYEKMFPMFLREPPTFAQVMNQLTEAEKKINLLPNGL